MSANGDDGEEEIPGRETAYRLFAAEYDDADFSYAESDEERAPNYVISPTGARLNRVFVVGTLTEVTSVNDEMVRARVVDPTGAFVVYAGQYQPDALATLEQLEAPAFVAVTGKARTFQPEDSEQVYTSIRPESIATVDADTRDRWVVSAAEQTVDRVGTYAGAAELDVSGDALTTALQEAGVETGLAAGIPLARDHYGTTPAYLDALCDCATEAVEVVADERDQVTGLSLAPGDSSPDGEATFDSLANLAGVDLSGLESLVATKDDSEAAPAEAAAATPGAGETAAEPDATADEPADPESVAGTATGTDRDTATEADTGGEGTTLEAGSPEAETTAAETDATVAETDTAADGTDADSEPTAEFEESTDIDEPDAIDTGAATDDPTSDTDDAAPETDDADEELGDFDAGDSGMYEMDDEEREQLEEEFGAEFTTGSEVEEAGEADIDVPDPDEEPATDELEAESEAAADAAGTDEAGTTAETETDADAADDDLGAPPESGLEAESEPKSESVTEPESEPEPETEVAEDEPSADESSETPESTEEDVDEDEEPAEDVDLESYVIETMEALDDGDGADRPELVERVVDDTGAAADDVEDAIQDALMGGQCYEPNDDTLKPI